MPILLEFIKKYTKIILEEFLSERETVELNVYDFDDTLCKTQGVIYVINKKTGDKKELHPHDFHEYNLLDNEEFDLSDFGTIENPEILPHFSMLKKDYERLGANGVSICTARPRADEINDFLKQEKMPDIEVVAVGTISPVGNDSLGEINALRKKEYLKKKIIQNKLSSLKFYDDNILNINAAKELIEEFPNINIKVYLVSTS